MPAKIRLQRHGRKGYAYYHIVIADSRAPRDGRFIERIGSYNPNTNPATIQLKFDRALYWMQVGAQPTDTVRSILSKEGVLLKKHLLTGVRKGAFSEEEAEKRFETWKSEKENQIAKTKEQLAAEQKAAEKKYLDAEKEKNKAKEEELAKKKAAELALETSEEKKTVEESPVTEELPVAEETPETESPAEELSVAEETSEEESSKAEEAPAE